MRAKIYYRLCKYVYKLTKYDNVRLWWGYYAGRKSATIADKQMASGFKAVFPAYTLPIIKQRKQ